MNDIQTINTATETPSVSKRRKSIIIFIVSIVGALVSISIDEQWSASWPVLFGMLLGGTLFPFAIAMLVAVFVRGLAGVITGVAIVVAVVGLAASSQLRSRVDRDRRERPKREFLNTVNQNERAANAAARTQLDQRGHIDVDPSTLHKTLGDISSQAKNLDPQTAAGTDALVAFTKWMMKPAEEGRASFTEIASKDFQDPLQLRSTGDIDLRLARIRAFRAAAQQLVDMYIDIDVKLKSELATKGLPPLKIKDFTDGYIRAAHLELSVPLARSNVEYADLLLREFELLKSRFGAWRVKNATIYFDDPLILQSWNEVARQLFALTERREALERKMLAVRESTAH